MFLLYAKANLVLFFLLLLCYKLCGNFILNNHFVRRRDKSLSFKNRGITSLTNDIIDWLLIMPGTNWCGVGDKANDYNDLGPYMEEDKCCREHDHCQDYINPLNSKNGLFNTNAIYAKLSCECDLQFLNCLQDVNSEFSSIVGGIYFNKLGTECFQLKYPIVKCLKYDLLPAVKCVQYLLDETKPKKYQWFDVPNYPTNRSSNVQPYNYLFGVLLPLLIKKINI